MLTERQVEALESLDGYLLFVMAQGVVTQDDVTYLRHLVDLLGKASEGGADGLAQDGKEAPWD